MANATPFQQNAAKTYILDGSRPLEAWYAAKDPETIFVDTGKEIITVKRIIDDYIKMIPWAEMSPAMREEAQGIIKSAACSSFFPQRRSVR